MIALELLRAGEGKGYGEKSILNLSFYTVCVLESSLAVWLLFFDPVADQPLFLACLARQQLASAASFGGPCCFSLPEFLSSGDGWVGILQTG